MRAAILAILLLPCLAEAQVIPGTPFGGAGPATSFAQPMPGDLELRDPSQLAAESLTNGALTAGTSWTRADDFALAANAATYTHATGAGYFYQGSASAEIPWASSGINGWFSLTYTTSAVTGTPACTINIAADDAFAVGLPALTEAAGTYTVVFQAKPTTLTNFVIQCTSSSAATVTFDTLSLKQINGGDLTVQGRVLVGTGSATAPALGPISGPTTGIYFTPTAVIFSMSGVAQWFVDGTALSPFASDAELLGAALATIQTTYLSRSIQGCKTSTLTETTADQFVTIAVPTGAGIGFAGGTVIYTVYASDGTDTGTISGQAKFAAANKSGTVTAAAIVDSQTLVAATSANTLTVAITAVTGASTVSLAANVTSSLIQTTLTICWRLDMPQANTVTPIP